MARYEGSEADVPIMIGDTEHRTDLVRHQVMPHKHSHRSGEVKGREGKVRSDKVRLDKVKEGKVR